MTEEFRIGVISSTHGLRGDVKVFPTTDDPARFRDVKEVVLDTGRERRRLRVRKVSFFKKFVIIGFEGLDRIEDVERMRGADLLVSREDALPLEEGEYYVPDLLGLRVVTEEGTELGRIRDVLFTGANDVYCVQRPGQGQKDLLIPVIEDCIKEVNLEEGYVKVWLMPGLLDL
ncbi:MAG: ribosome maturation factor RimM [Lachnospiraceae bacterium]|nr:ribosome maturation factor RimM [Lachnospiraceae bacterium]